VTAGNSIYITTISGVFVFKKFFAGAFIAVASVALIATPASAEPVTGPPAEQYPVMEAFLNDQGLDAGTVDSLIGKWERGETWDSMSGAAPVSTNTQDVDGFTVTTDTFADGSINSMSVEIPTIVPPGTIQPFAVGEVNSCTRSGTTKYTYRGCKIRGVSGFVTMNANASYTGGGSRGNENYAATINSFDNCNASVVNGGYSNLSCGRIRSTASSQLSALARYGLSASLWNGTHGVTLEFFVNYGGSPSSRINSNI